MAWGEEKCMFCDQLINRDGTTACACLSRVTYRKEPEGPISATRLYYNQGPSLNSWQDACTSFINLSIEDREHWERKALADRSRYEREKKEYNEQLNLDDEILTDKDEEDGMECGYGVAEIRQALQRRRCEQEWSRYRQDHPRFNRTFDSPHNKTPSPNTFHPFFSLPTEIRDQIYAHCFSPSRSSPNNEIRQWHLLYESANHEPELRFTHLHPLDTRLLAANRQIYTEALEILFSSKTFIVDISRASVPPLFVADASDNVPPRPTAKIRKWHIRLTFTDLSHKDSILPQLKLAHDALASSARIDEVRFTWITVPDYWTELPDLRTAYDDMLRKFSDLRGVGEVVFTEHYERSETDNLSMLLGGWDNVHLASESVRRDVKANMEKNLC
ncbi:MAG: hypothetical protein Q9182_002956 [Xanthomendoza sp. 2 TL-2023]